MTYLNILVEYGSTILGKIFETASVEVLFLEGRLNTDI